MAGIDRWLHSDHNRQVPLYIFIVYLFTRAQTYNLAIVKLLHHVTSAQKMMGVIRSVYFDAHPNLQRALEEALQDAAQITSSKTKRYFVGQDGFSE